MIGVFDSGIGGLSILRELARLLPQISTLYLADQAHLPYGERLAEEVQALTLRCASWLVARGCDPIVIACNTASAAALDLLRQRFPHIRFVGVEPAVKPAARQTRSGVIGVLATRATLQSRRYADLLDRWVTSARIVEHACPSWVEAVEAMADQSVLEALVAPCVHSLLDQGADALVLGCTHFPFLSPWIARAIAAWREAHPDAPEITVIDPAPAVAQQTVRQIGEGFAQPESVVVRRFVTTGDPMHFSAVASYWLGWNVDAEHAQC
ncbi:MAG: glutamate racemase [Anaerolineae bacterium]|nr:glutamate racemase [Thermoflexales bacterium]MDW8394619.1 glutamate racemase [Anaerolineae bacterium]